VVIKTEFPLGTIIRNKDANGHITKWAIELCPFDLEFTRRDTIKSQTLADFMVEWTDLSIPTSQGPVDYWKMYFDGSLTIEGAGAGILFISPTNEQLRYILRIHFPASNNAAEYEACFHGLHIVVDLGIKRLYVHGDLALVINQLNKDWDTTSEKMDAYCKEIRKLEGKFYGIEYSHVVRDKNQAADVLSKLGSSRAQVPHDVFVQDLLKPSIKQEGDPVVEKPPDEPLVAMVPSPTTMALSPTTVGPSQTSTKMADWRVTFIKYLTDGTEYSDRNENERLIRRSKQYLVVEGKLWRKNAKVEVLMKCIEQEDGIKLLEEIHSGTCGNHVASRTLVGKAFCAGFYWPSAVADAEKFVRHYANCQFFSKRVHVPAHEI
jgi:ribonuclease HI